MASGSQQVLGQVAAMAGAALATAVVSSIELAEPQNTPRVEVRVAYVAKDSITNVFVSARGRPVPAFIVPQLFREAFPEGSPASSQLMFASKEADGDLHRYTITPAPQGAGQPVLHLERSVRHTAAMPTTCCTFKVSAMACTPVNVYHTVDRVMCGITMVGPPVQTTLSHIGFDGPLRAANEDALPQGQAYHVEGLPFASTLQERLATGCNAFTAREALRCGAASPACMTYTGSFSADDAVKAKRCNAVAYKAISGLSKMWTGSAAVLVSDTAPDAQDGGAGGSAQRSVVHLFDNYAPVQRPTEQLATALKYAPCWEEFGLDLEDAVPGAGCVTLIFKLNCAALVSRLHSFAVHLLCGDLEWRRASSSGRPAGLQPNLENSLVRGALRGALAEARRAHPHDLISLYERRSMRWVGIMARYTQLTVELEAEDAPEFAEVMRGFAGCSLEYIEPQYQRQLERACSRAVRKAFES